jgi:ubiquinone/menaquinone biosynthesis C-methylase UbiE
LAPQRRVDGLRYQELIMDVSQQTEDEQAKRWNGVAGRAWVDSQDVVDQMFQPVQEVLIDAVLRKPAGRVLDIGCGTGGTTLAVARALGVNARCVGLDISEPMIEAARARADRSGMPVTFIRANAQTYTFDAAVFDKIISRFGVMFFDDPVRAFANLRSAATNDGELRVIAWRSGEDNPFMTTAERAAAPLLSNLPARQANAPGQFAFADERRVARILDKSGWAEIDIERLDVACSFPESQLVRYFTRLGPVGMVIDEVDEPTRERVVERVRAAFEPYVHGADVRFTAACWMVTASASASSRR